MGELGRKRIKPLALAPRDQDVKQSYVEAVGRLSREPPPLPSFSNPRIESRDAMSTEVVDFRAPVYPDDRVLALRTVMEAKGDALPEPPRCHGYSTCCRCPRCKLRERRPERTLAAA